MSRKEYRFWQAEKAHFLHRSGNPGKIHHRSNARYRKNNGQTVAEDQAYQDIQIFVYSFQQITRHQTDDQCKSAYQHVIPGAEIFNSAAAAPGIHPH